MALRAVPRTRNSRMARSIDRNPTREFAAGYFERVSGRPVHQRTVAADQRPHRAARRQRFLHAVLLRQFRLTRRTNVEPLRSFEPCGVSSLGAVSRSTARYEIDPGDGSLWSANDHPRHFRELWRHRLRQKLSLI